MQVRRLLCAALTSSQRPLTITQLAQLVDLSRDETRAALQDLQVVLREQSLGLVVEEVAGGYRLLIDPVLTPALITLFAPTPLPRLSQAAIETLALVAYHQPMTRGELEAARGASCASTLETLQERDLIQIVGRKDVIGKPLLYGTSDKFLIEFGLKSLEDLPPLAEQPGEFLRG